MVRPGLCSRQKSGSHLFLQVHAVYGTRCMRLHRLFVFHLPSLELSHTPRHIYDVCVLMGSSVLSPMGQEFLEKRTYFLKTDSSQGPSVLRYAGSLFLTPYSVGTPSRENLWQVS